MKKIIVTIGPAIWGESTLNKINNKNIIYRINGAHIEPKSIIQHLSPTTECNSSTITSGPCPK